MKKRLLLLLILIDGLAGCASSKEEIFPLDANVTMMETWRTASGRQTQLAEARAVLRRPLDDNTDIQTPYSRDAVNEIDSQFTRLPNPDLVMYVFPHLAGGNPVPVPGYTTVFPMHTRVEYAMPGERVENY